MSATEAVLDARTAVRARNRVYVAVAVAGFIMFAVGVSALIVVLNGVAERVERAEWRDCVQTLTDAKEAHFEEKIGDLLVARDPTQAAQIAADIDAFDLTPTRSEKERECGEHP